ncbi:MAG: DUF86 domain-containing protein [Planctomycetes bacterium]|nr:DUF86 domain-containing protein [Planctomycetota bacterium]MBM4078355.1 DUF86 domain-containing protein [Planctomycetota bacterium]MBM4084165.1 DUF86 domain-containing protein [Planctomycetota bacterium]
MSRDFRLYLEDILAAAEKVLRFSQGYSLAEFVRDEKTFDAVVRNLEIIGEAAKHVPQEVRQRYPQVEWRKMTGLRDVIAHEYFGLDEDILWDVIHNFVPKLLEHVPHVLKQEGTSEGGQRQTG